jgi:hypothetical protein
MILVEGDKASASVVGENQRLGCVATPARAKVIKVLLEAIHQIILL